MEDSSMHERVYQQACRHFDKIEELEARVVQVNKRILFNKNLTSLDVKKINEPLYKEKKKLRQEIKYRFELLRELGPVALKAPK